jgi:Response regulator receiver domain
VEAGRRPRVLIVDDNAVIARMLGEMLHWLGVDAEELLQGRDPLARLDGDDGYDLLVADLHMSEINGWDLAQAASGAAGPSARPAHHGASVRGGPGARPTGGVGPSAETLHHEGVGNGCRPGAGESRTRPLRRESAPAALLR